jgi:hypothetical protein
MVAWDAGVRAELAEARLAEVTVNPFWGPQAELPVLLPKLGLPTADVADAMPAKLRGIARLFRDLGERPGRKGPGPPAGQAWSSRRSPSSTAGCAAIEQDPLLVAPSPRSPTRALDGRAPGGHRERRPPALAAYRDILRDELLAAPARGQVGLR